jgi:hypothetical protein
MRVARVLEHSSPDRENMIKVLKNVRLEDSNVAVGVTDPASFLCKALQSTNKWPSLMVYMKRSRDSNERYVAGVDFELLNPLPRIAFADSWYWPSASPEPRFFDHRRPRYRDLRSAVIESAQMNNGEAVYVFAHTRLPVNDELYLMGVRVRPRGWFDDPDHVQPGAMRSWWTAWFKRAHTTEPVLWRGSDSDMSRE